MLRKMTTSFCLLFLFLYLFNWNTCDAQSSSPPVSTPGEFFTIAVGGLNNNKYFEIFVTNPSEIKKGRELFDKRAVFVPHGKVIKGSPNGLNFPFSWHLDPSSVTFTENSVEIYDGSPYQVEAELDIWIKTLGFYAPWGCQIAGIGKRKSVPLPLVFSKSKNSTQIVIDAHWHHKGPYSFTKLFGVRTLPKGIPLNTQVKVNAFYEHDLGGTTMIRVQPLTILERKALNKK